TAPERVRFIPGRGQAIAACIAGSRVDDVLLLAGKGHEDYQEIKGERQPFSDLHQAASALDDWEAADA
ncbi:MAG TPA: UDP-N-acetylmuramoyl-L-alanyl-D-glutamate--2,6-diaminopimelate ligase, partial [Pseudomonas sp.]|nr:UDP-N-acetylmuramoyl-L-alanyl-D-glutamate--2,6-diaminopimelate ligase [Pseudomonas sp.]